MSFRDETQRVAAKFQGHPGRSNIQQPQRSQPADALENQLLVRECATSGTPSVLSVSPLDQAVTFFFRSHVDEAAESCSLIFKYLPSLYNTDHNSALPYIIKAIGLAGLSSYRSAPSLMSSASSYYTLALKITYHALQDSTQAKTDQTLLAVYLLGFYEV